MVKTKRELVFATFVTSGLAVIATLVSLGTQNWVSSEVKITEKFSQVNYGLFTGLYRRTVGSERPMIYDISMTCSMSDNKCAMLCEATSEARSAKLTALIENNNSSFGCMERRQIFFNPQLTSTRDDSSQSTFINAGLWLSTIIFLVLSSVAGLGATVLAMFNTVYNPIEIYVNITGLFIWNCVAIFFSLLTMIMWGVLYASVLIDNISVYDTIVADGYTVNAILNYSYWLNLVAFVLYVSSVILIAVRQYLINKEPLVMHADIQQETDPGLLIY
nr:clarin-3-like [Onthophagus taurus]